MAELNKKYAIISENIKSINENIASKFNEVNKQYSALVNKIDFNFVNTYNNIKEIKDVSTIMNDNIDEIKKIEK